MLGQKPMIQWVYEGASSLFDHLLVATDDRRIFEAVRAFGGKVVMTSEAHKSGTERCAEAARIHEKESGLRFSHVVNIQGDEPLIQPGQIQTLMDCILVPGTPIATLIRSITEVEELENPNVVKVVVDLSSRALYFSRASIPRLRDSSPGPKSGIPDYYAHIGLYAFRREVLDQVVTLPPSPLEQAESLEQLRWMEHGFRIRTAVTSLPTLGVDTPEDLEKIRLENRF